MWISLTASFYKENVSLIKTAVDEVRVGIEEIRCQFQRDTEQTSFRDVSLSEPKYSYTGIFHMICNMIFIGETIEGEDFP